MPIHVKQFKKFLLPIIILLFICTIAIGSSPLFKTNPWCDTNAMFTMGRAMTHGLVPYRDIIDQRGPLLYLLFALGSLIKSDNFLGIFLIQVVNILIVYALTWRIVQVMKIRVLPRPWLALIGPMVLLSTSAYSFGGSPEEFAFTSILYLLLVAIKFKRLNVIPDKTFFWLGLNLGIIFWNKYSMIGAYVVFFVIVLISFLRKKAFKKLLIVTEWSLAGFLLVTGLILLYFVIHHALADAFNIYFIQNMTRYGSTNQTLLMKLWSLLLLMAQAIKDHLIVATIIMLGWAKSIADKKSITIEVAMFLGSILFIAVQHWVNTYYNLVWIVFLIPALLRFTRLIPRKLNQGFVKTIELLLVSAVIFLPLINNEDLGKLIVLDNRVSFNSLEQWKAQPRFAEVMKKTQAHPTLLMINDLDEGFFLAAGIVPTTKYWQQLNMSYLQLPEMYQSFKNSMRDKKTDFVIVKLKTMPASGAEALKQQIATFVEPHLYRTLMKNYRIKAVAQNSPDESYVLLYRK
ncbi:teichoic acid glycosyl transferase [Companilactobacillus sp. FL22-1]|uniref:teichoic acid glycosyl transferase n=1 Tax=Companilactobacillus sp. FL22-1 TaxID=3373892 RepID=UPI003754BE8D